MCLGCFGCFGGRRAVVHDETRVDPQAVVHDETHDETRVDPQAVVHDANLVHDEPCVDPRAIVRDAIQTEWRYWKTKSWPWIGEGWAPSEYVLFHTAKFQACVAPLGGTRVEGLGFRNRLWTVSALATSALTFALAIRNVCTVDLDVTVSLQPIDEPERSVDIERYVLRAGDVRWALGGCAPAYVPDATDIAYTWRAIDADADARVDSGCVEVLYLKTMYKFHQILGPIFADCRMCDVWHPTWKTPRTIRISRGTMLLEKGAESSRDALFSGPDGGGFHVMKERLDVVREELMQRAWHPSRHVEWCLDVEDRAELLADPS